MSRFKKIRYAAKYTAGSYADASMTIPIWAAEKIAKGSEKIFRDKNPKFLSWDYIQNKSGTYKTREKLRESLDTRPGVLHLQNSIMASIPFTFIGLPAAELAQAGINEYLPDIPKIAQYAINSTTTLAAQMATGYTGFIASELRANKQKYVDENGKISAKKIRRGLANAAKMFLWFDVPYSVGKLGTQSYLLSVGKDPWKASALFDAVATPLWYAVTISFGMWKRILETKQTDEWDEEARNSKLEALVSEPKDN